ncbi:MAG: DUF4097 family beta strand repeat protein [Deltaproteobacteria bacterium]|nr:DUF4097 family beta strand repeat protein [Deltaproteobacteria bacterium]MBW2414774.1 DUF4097 family beta strand repeat protein [Deltaproteobacteria bacterium]
MSRHALALPWIAGLLAAALLPAVLLPGAVLAADFRGNVNVESGGTLEVELSAGSVEIDSHDEEQVEVEARADSFGGSFRFELTSDGKDARLTGSGSSWFGFSASSVSVRITVPREYAIDLETGGGRVEIDDVEGDIVVHTNGGRIEVDGAVGQVEVETSGGRISIDDVDGDVRARTSGGSIDVSEVTGEVDVRTSGGHIQIHDVGGPVFAHTSGGRISVRFNDLAEGEIQTSGGSIEVEVPEGSGIDLDASTSGGRVSLDDDVSIRGSVDRAHVVGEINGGGSELRLRTSGGNVRLRAR